MNGLFAAAVADSAKAHKTLVVGRRSETRRRGVPLILTLGGANRKIPNEIFSKKQEKKTTSDALWKRRGRR